MTTQTAPAATGLLKQVRICPETTYGVPLVASSASAQLLRRVSSDVSLKKATYRSNEIQPDRQIHDFRHGVRSVHGTVKAELSPLTYESVFAQILAGSFAAGGVSTGLTITAVAAVAGNPGTAATFARTAGSFVTDGFKLGDVVRSTGFTSGAAANNNRNYRITGFSQTTNPNDTISVGPAPNNSSGSTVENQPNTTEVVVAATGATGIGFTTVGKKLVTPTAGSLIDTSFSLEHFFSDVSQSELFTGCRASSASVSLPPTGLGTVDFDFMGQNLTSNTAQYFTAAQASTTTGITASVNGLMRVNGVDYAIVTGLSFKINANYTPETVVGSNQTPYLFPGWQDITGQFTALFVDQQLESAFLAESEISLQVTLTIEDTVNADFLNFYFPRIKLTSGDKDDKPGAIVGTYGFQALNNINFGTNLADETTLMIQDSLAV